MVPEYIIDWFKQRFKLHPSFTWIDNVQKTSLEKLTQKSELLHYKKKFVEDKNLFISQLFEYDSTGILIYNELIEDEKKENYKVFILSKVDKQNIVDFIMFNLKKNKNGN